MSLVTIAQEDAEGPLAAGLLHSYYEELAARFPAGFDLEGSLEAPVSEFMAPGGVFLVARIDDKPVGCGAVRKLDPTTGEIKRMWVDPAARRLGVGRGLLGALEDAATAFGYASVRLDTSAHLPEALALYRSLGYHEIEAYNDNQHASHWLEKNLAETAATGPEHGDPTRRGPPKCGPGRNASGADS